MKFGSEKFGSKKDVKAEPVPYEEVKPEVKEEVPMTGTGFSLMRGTNGGFSLVKLAYNADTKEAKVLEVKKVADSREEAEYYFRIAVGEWMASEELNS